MKHTLAILLITASAALAQESMSDRAAAYAAQSRQEAALRDIADAVRYHALTTQQAIESAAFNARLDAAFDNPIILPCRPAPSVIDHRSCTQKSLSEITSE